MTQNDDHNVDQLTAGLEASGRKRQTVDEWLNNVSYGTLNDGHYVPSIFALKFLNFMKLVNGSEGEENKTPVVHLVVLDQLAGTKQQIANLCHRGFSKALDIQTPIPTPTGWTTMGDLKIGDEILGEDGKPTKVVVKSEVHHKPMYRLHLADGRALDVCEDHLNVVMHRRTTRTPAEGYRYGKTKAVTERRVLSTKELLKLRLTATRSKTVKNPKGREHKVFIPVADAVEYGEKNLPVDPYTLGMLIGDGSMDRDTGYARLHCHVDDLPHYQSKVPYEFGRIHYDKRNPNVVSVGIRGIGAELKALGLNCHGNFKFIPDDYFFGSIEQRQELLRGLMDTDGCAEGSAVFATSSEELSRNVMKLVYSLGGTASRNEYVASSGRPAFRVTINTPFNAFSLDRKKAKGTHKFRKHVPLTRIEAIAVTPSQCIQVDNDTKTFLAGDFVVTHNTTLAEYLTFYVAVFGGIEGFGDISGMLYVSDSMENGAKGFRKNLEHRFHNSAFLQAQLPHYNFTDPYIELGNSEGHKLGLRLFGAKTGVRGTRIFNQRPTFAILDDLISDDDAKSKTALAAIQDTVYRGVMAALHPTRRKVMLNGTPFNKSDIVIGAVESGAWHVNVWPVCEKFPCSKEEFHGSWEDRFTYEFVKTEYEKYVLLGRVSDFMQEYMLRITAEEDRLILDSDIRWYERHALLANRDRFNFYITTDFATTAKQSADYSVISVWAYNANGDWFWVDGICKKQTIDKTFDDLFRLAQAYNPQSVGVEVSGQQGGFVSLLQKEMLDRNIWFNFAQNKNGEPGLRPITDKLSRFNKVVPWFKAGKMYFPSEMRSERIMGEVIDELTLATGQGFKSKNDDFIDTISQLAELKTFKPTGAVPMKQPDISGPWFMELPDTGDGTLDSYIV